MLTGFNEDIQYHGTTYHIQTEDKGRDNPFIETLVYSGGQIVHRERYSYKDMARNNYSEAAVADLLDTQHKRIVLYAQLGRYDDRPKPLFGERFISDRTLDEVITDYLEKEENIEPVALSVSSHKPLISKQIASIEVEVKEKVTGNPIAGAKLKVKIITSTSEPVEIDAGKTDPKGRARISFTVPELTSEEGLFLIQATSKAGLGEYKEIIHFE